jgi:hypothetical protein
MDYFEVSGDEKVVLELCRRIDSDPQKAAELARTVLATSFYNVRGTDIAALIIWFLSDACCAPRIRPATR